MLGAATWITAPSASPFFSSQLFLAVERGFEASVYCTSLINNWSWYGRMHLIFLGPFLEIFLVCQLCGIRRLESYRLLVISTSVTTYRSTWEERPNPVIFMQLIFLPETTVWQVMEGVLWFFLLHRSCREKQLLTSSYSACVSDCSCLGVWLCAGPHWVAILKVLLWLSSLFWNLIPSLIITVAFPILHYW